MSSMAPVSALDVRSQKLSNVGRSSEGWLKIYYLELLQKAEVSQIFLRDAHILPKLLSYEVTGGKPIAAWSQSISGVSAINPLVAFYDIHGI
jgi:hypothetical protein